MKRNVYPVKRIISLLLAVITMGLLFSACGNTAKGAPYTFRVQTDETGERQWTVKPDDSTIVSYTIQAAEDGAADVVFTGLKRGKTNATLFLARTGESASEADDVYVLTLQVDARKNVTQSEPRYGAYTVRLKGDVTGAEWNVEFSDERIVHYIQDREYPKKSKNEDGMQEFTQLYSFTGRRPGAVHVRIYVTYPWSEGADNTRKEFWLMVDDEYRVSLLEPTDFTSFRLSEQDTSAIHDVYEAKRTADGVQLSHYNATYNWSDEAGDFVETRTDETVIDGGEALYMYLAGLLHAYDVPDWDGFKKSNTHVLDGTMFSFEAELADGTKVTASGSNAFPQHYRDFCACVCAAAACAPVGETE